MNRTVAYSAVAVAVACVAVAGGFYGWTETHKETHGTLYWDADVVYEDGHAVALIYDYTLTGDKKEWVVMDVWPFQMSEAIEHVGYYLDPGTHSLRIPGYSVVDPYRTDPATLRPMEEEVDPSTFRMITSCADVRTGGGRPPAR